MRIRSVINRLLKRDSGTPTQEDIEPTSCSQNQLPMGMPESLILSLASHAAHQIATLSSEDLECAASMARDLVNDFTMSLMDWFKDLPYEQSDEIIEEAVYGLSPRNRPRGQKEGSGMAKVQIWREGNTGRDVPRLRLVRENENIYLCAVNADGDVIPKGRLMVIKDKGVRLLSDCPDIGLPMDDYGRLETY